MEEKKQSPAKELIENNSALNKSAPPAPEKTNATVPPAPAPANTTTTVIPSKEEAKVLQIEQVQSFWNRMVRHYLKFEYTPQTFYITLINMLNIQQSKRILDVGCGTCLMFPILQQMRKDDSAYIGLDLSDDMLLIAEQRIKHYFTNPTQSFSTKMALSVLDTGVKFKGQAEFPEHFVKIIHQNGQDLSQFESESFDTYICNLVLMLTENADKMIAQCQRVLKKGGRAGFTVWGRPENTSYATILPTIFQNNGVTSPAVRSNFHLGDREALIKKFQDAGFINIIAWYQVSPFSFQTKQDYVQFLGNPSTVKVFETLEKEKITQIMNEFFEAMDKRIGTDKQPLTLEGLQIIVQKA